MNWKKWFPSIIENPVWPEPLPPRADLQDKIDADLIQQFKGDLVGLEEPDLIRAAYREVRDQLDELEPWADALCAYARRHNIEL
ncbi:hypothetical protein ACSSV1_001889 [Labrenzia sp. MBR-25]